MVLTGLGNMVSEMNFMMFLLFINSQTEVAKEEKEEAEKRLWLLITMLKI